MNPYSPLEDKLLIAHAIRTSENLRQSVGSSLWRVAAAGDLKPLNRTAPSMRNRFRKIVEVGAALRRFVTPEQYKYLRDLFEVR